MGIRGEGGAGSASGSAHVVRSCAGVSRHRGRGRHAIAFKRGSRGYGNAAADGNPRADGHSSFAGRGGHGAASALCRAIAT